MSRRHRPAAVPVTIEHLRGAVRRDARRHQVEVAEVALLGDQEVLVGDVALGADGPETLTLVL